MLKTVSTLKSSQLPDLKARHMVSHMPLAHKYLGKQNRVRKPTQGSEREAVNVPHEILGNCCNDKHTADAAERRANEAQ